MEDTPSRSLFADHRIFLDVPGAGLEEALGMMAGRLLQAGDISDARELARRLIEREKQGTNGIGGGLAIPHCKLPGLDHPLLAVGVCSRGVDFHALDGRPVRLIFLVISCADSPSAHLQVLARISRLAKLPGITEAILAAKTPERIGDLLRDADSRLSVL